MTEEGQDFAKITLLALEKDDLGQDFFQNGRTAPIDEFLSKFFPPLPFDNIEL